MAREPKRLTEEAQKKLCLLCSEGKILDKHIHWLQFPFEQQLLAHLQANLESNPRMASVSPDKDRKAFLEDRVNRIIDWRRAIRYLYGRAGTALWQSWIEAHIDNKRRQRDTLSVVENRSAWRAEALRVSADIEYLEAKLSPDLSFGHY